MKRYPLYRALALAALTTATLHAQEDYGMIHHEQISDQALLIRSGAIRYFSPRATIPFETHPQGAMLATLLARHAQGSYLLGREFATQALDYFLTKVPVDEHYSSISMERAARYMSEGDFHRARHALLQVDERDLASEERTEYQVRLGYALLRTHREPELSQALFEEAHTKKNRWGRMARLYVASHEISKGNLSAAREIYTPLLADQELAPEARIGMATLSYYSGDYAKAVAEVAQLERQEPRVAGNASLLQVAGNAYYRLGDAPNASKYLERLLDGSNDEFVMAEDALLLGAAYMEQELYDKAIEPLKRATEGKGLTAYAASLYLGRALRDQGNYPQAIVAYERAAEEQAPDSVREAAMYEMALVMRSSGQSNFGQDVRIAERFLNTFPNSKHRPTMERFLTEFYLSNTNYATSLASIQRLEKRSKALDEARQYVLNHLALEALSQEDLTTASRYIAQALEARAEGNRYQGESLLIQADILRQGGDYAASIQPLKSFLALPQGMQGGNRGEALYYLGYALFNTRQYAEARNQFSAFVQTGEGNALRRSDGYTRLGDCYYVANALDAAFASYQKAMDLAPNRSSEALLRMADIHGLRKQYTQQIALLDRLMNTYPNSPVAAQSSYQKARAYLLQGKNSEAERGFVETASRYAQSEEGRLSLLQLALLYYNAQRVQQALDTYAQLMQRYPKSAEAATAFSHLKSICIEEGRTDYLQKVVRESKGTFSLSEGESREIEFQSVESAYKRQPASAEAKLQEFIDRYKTGRDVLMAQLYLADGAYTRGDKEKSYAIYSLLAREVEQLPRTMQAKILQRLGSLQQERRERQAAYDTYRKLYDISAERSVRLQAAESAAELALQMEQGRTVIAMVTEALTSLGQEGGERLILLRGAGHELLSERDKALAEYKKIASQTDLSAGAEALVAYTNLLAHGSAKEKKEAKQMLNKFIEQGTPHEYWLARGILQLAEIYRSEGDRITANQYIESLKSNYPEREDDIRERIDLYLKQQK